MVPIEVVEAILQNVTFQDYADEYPANDTDQFEDHDQEVITRWTLYHCKTKALITISPHPMTDGY